MPNKPSLFTPSSEMVIVAQDDFYTLIEIDGLYLLCDDGTLPTEEEHIILETEDRALALDTYCSRNPEFHHCTPPDMLSAVELKEEAIYYPNLDN